LYEKFVCKNVCEILHLKVNEEKGLDEAEAVAEDEDDEEEDAHVQVGEDLLEAGPARRLKCLKHKRSLK
jgi:hypothetical protein